MKGLLIGEVAERAGVPAPTIRYYESLGLLKPAGRSAAGYRRYAESAIEELRFIKKAQALGFSLDEIGEILNLARSGTVPCSRVLSLAHQHLAAVDERIRQLQEFRDALGAEVRTWDKRTTTACEGLCQLIAGAGDAARAITIRLEAPERVRGEARSAGLRQIAEEAATSLRRRQCICRNGEHRMRTLTLLQTNFHTPFVR